jgi:Na+-translocating ferredoxin:NAD+ oxidoreductase RnfG subunit
MSDRANRNDSTIENPKSNIQNSNRVWLMQTLRTVMLAGVLFCLHQAHARRLERDEAARHAPLDVEQILGFFPQAARLGEYKPSLGGQLVENPGGEVIGYVLQTSPLSDNVIGYSGPTNTLIAFDPQDHILGTRILNSEDTREHVRAVKRNPEFCFTWNGMTRDEAREFGDVDAVSGSTLTSIAIVRGIQKRLGGEPPNLKFPREVTLDEVRELFPQAASLETGGIELTALDEDGTPLGTVVRTSPFSDTVNGYQGPTETLLAFDTGRKLLGIRLRDSYDNEPYVGYIREDDYFLNSLNGKSVEELAQLDLFEEQVEGVSGATMTSLAVAEGLIPTAQAMLDSKPARQQEPSSFRTAWNPRLRDLGTLAVLLAGSIIGFTDLRGWKSLRIAYLGGVVIYLGFLNGDMLSQAFLVGAARNGLPWQSALGVSLLSVSALAIPIVSKKQIYCHHICPHGALQQLVKGRFAQPRSLPRFLDQVGSVLPVSLLLLTVLVGMFAWRFNLASIEPFDAYLFRVAGWGTLSVAIAGLAVSLFVPMAYCRYGCPTGSLLSFLRLNAHSDRWNRRDTCALVLLLVAVGILMSGA